jgi:hypothetical protein
MLGYVLAFRPTTGRGTIVTEGGQAYFFHDPPEAGDLKGGDVVSFETAASEEASSGRARDIRLIQRWSQGLTDRERPLIRQLLTALQSPRSSR